MSAASLTLTSVSKVRRKQIRNTLIYGIVFYTYGAIEGSENYLFIALFYNIQNKVALTYRAGQNVHKIFFHQDSPLSLFGLRR
jgi:hypothetical protein